MTDEEFARLYPNAGWPRSLEGRHGTRLVPAGLPRLQAGFSDPPLTADAPLRASMGFVRARTATSRERMLDLINRALYGDGGVGTEGNERSRRLADALDLTPVGVLHQSYDTGRAIGEGRLDDATLSSGLAFLPAVRKSPVNGLFNPKPKPLRHFSQDYPFGGGAPNEFGMLRHDIEGRPLRAPYLAGRVRPDEPDHALRPIEIQRVGEHGTEGDVAKVPAESLGPGNLGETHLLHGRPWEIRVLDSLPKDKMDMATAHEVGHVVDALSGRIPAKDIEDELDFVYSALRTGEERKYLLSRPQDFGYKGKAIDRERIAEAIRAYMVDPNYLKTVAPKTAARIRKYVADSDDLANIIQFNGLAAGGVLAGVAAGQGGDAEAGEMPGKGNMPGSLPPSNYATLEHLDRLTRALMQRGLFPQPPRNEALSGLVNALLDRQARP
ncbi:MAG: hypothetical protein AB7S92_15970 [Parvibaculaceae bacterium]